MVLRYHSTDNHICGLKNQNSNQGVFGSIGHQKLNY